MKGALDLLFPRVKQRATRTFPFPQKAPAVKSGKVNDIALHARTLCGSSIHQHPMKAKFCAVFLTMAGLSGMARGQAPAPGPSFSDPNNPPPPPGNVARPPFSRGNGSDEVLRLLGPLSSDLFVCFSMDMRSRGSLVYARDPRVFGTFSGSVQFQATDARASASVAAPDACLRLITPFNIGPAYTLAGWVELPLPNRHGVVWQSKAGSPLYLTESKFMCWSDRAYEFCAFDPALTGWNHVAVTCDGTETAFYLNGVRKGAARVAVDGSLKTIGNHMLPQEMSTSHCGGLDDMFAFTRALLPEEIATLVSIRVPISPEVAMNSPAPFPTTLPPQPAAPTGPSAESAAATAELVKTQRNNLVFVSGTDGSGSGFLANYGHRTFLFTNAHVAAGVRGAGFKRLQGDPVQIGSASVAIGHDIFLMQAAATSPPLQIMMGVDENTSIGDEIVVLGNAEGAGVINTIMGRIVGVGPNLIEVDAPFKPGNSGSPIIHLRSGKVIGAATYLTIRKFDSATNQPVKEPIVRRFGYRIDSVKAWQPVQWPAFFTQAQDLEAIEKLTADLITFLEDLARDSRVSSAQHTNPAIKSRIDAWLGSKNRRMSDIDRKTADQNFLSFLRITCQSDITAAQSRLTYDYFQRALGEEEKQRTQIADIFGKIIKEIQNAR